MAIDLTPKRALSLWSLHTRGRDSADARDEHFRILTELLTVATSEDLSQLPLCPVHQGLTETEFRERYDSIAFVFTRQLEKGQPTRLLLKNYCNFLWEKEPRRALEVAEKDLILLAPDDPDTYRLLALLRRRLIDDDANVEENRRILEALKKEVSLRGRDQRTLNYALLELAETAYLANVLDDAWDAAQSCIDEYQLRVGRHPDDAIQPRVFHRAHIVLGHIASDRGDIETAKAHLLASVRVPAGENRAIDYVALDLARRLLNLGETATILEFLEDLEPRCSECDRPRVDSFRSSMGLNQRAE